MLPYGYVSSYSPSSKTRIETINHLSYQTRMRLLPIHLPVKQGLKPRELITKDNYQKLPIHLPVKQGLKLKWLKT